MKYVLTYTSTDIRVLQPSRYFKVSNPDVFITERAYDDLRALTNFGPRITGSYANEVLTVDFLKRTIDGIIREAHSNQSLEMSVQTVSGSYYLDFASFGAINAYGNVQNVVAKIVGFEGTHSVLVNSHFDSVPTSPGKTHFHTDF